MNEVWSSGPGFFVSHSLLAGEKTGKRKVMVKGRVSLLSGVIATFLVIIFQGDVSAGGFDNSYIGIRGGAMGHALTGLADDASAVYYNPAGLVFNQTRKWDAEGYVYFNFVKFKYKDNTGAVATTDKADLFYYVPGFFFCRRFERVALGCGTYVPYGGGGVDYKDFQGSGFNFKYLAGFSALTPAVAFKVFHNLSIGMAVSLYYGQMENEMFRPDLSSFVKSKYDDIAGVGWHLGFLYKPLKVLSLGCTVRSQVPVKMGGSIRVLSIGLRSSSSVAFTLPHAFSIGLGYRPNPKMTFGLTCNYILWGDMDEIVFETGGVREEAKTRYKDSVLVGMGMEYRLQDKLALRGGLKFAQGATQDRGLTFASNDIDLLVFSAGVGYAVTSSVDVDLNVAYTYGLEKEFQGRTYDLDTILFLIGMQYKR